MRAMQPLCLLLASSGEASPTYVVDVLVILGTAAAIAIVLQRARLALIPAYLIAGAIVGPHAVRLVRSPESLESISSLAILLLMFGIGLHLHLSALGRSLARMLLIGGVSTIVTIAALWPVAIGFGLAAPAALALCMALSASSTALVLRLIAERGELKHASGRLALAILVVQDMLVIPMLAVMPLLAQWAGASEATDPAHAPDWPQFLSGAALRIVGIAGLIIVGHLVLPRLLREAARERTGEVMMVVSVAAAIGAGVCADALGFPAALGAFIAGFLLASTPFRHQISGQIAPLRNLFMAVFFTTLGMQLRPQMLIDHWWVIVAGGAIMTLIKALMIGGVSWCFGAPPTIAVAVGFALAQGGEFGLVLLDAARDRGVLDDVVVVDAAAIIVISLILTPGLVGIGRAWSERWRSVRCAPWILRGLGEMPAGSQPESAASRGSRRRAIVGGYGQVGRAVVAALREAGIDCAIVEINSDCVRDRLAEQSAGLRFIFGDVSNPEVLESAGIAAADALVLTMPDEESALRACAIARRLQPGILITARIVFASHQRMAKELGADVVIVEELETARGMKEAVLARLA